MKKSAMALMTLTLSLSAASIAWAGAFENYYDYENPDGTYSYYFDQGEGVFVTMDEEWYKNTRVVIEDSGAAFYHSDSYNAYAGKGMKGGRLFTIGASVNSSFQELPSFEYIGFDDEDFMNYYAELPTDYQAYMEDESIRAEYDALWAGVKDVIAGIRIGKEESGRPETEADTAKADNVSVSEPDYIPDEAPPAIITSGNYAYYVNSDAESVTITEYTGDEEVVEIPSEIDGYQVTDIGSQAFSYGKMSRVVFPESIRTIGQRAFEYCDINDVEIPEGTTVQICAFGYCDFLKQVLVGKDAVIESRAFGYCEDLETVVLADGSRLEKDTFEYCRDIEKVILCGSVEVEDGAFYDCDKMEFVQEDESEFENWKLSDAVIGQSDLTGGLTGGLSGGWEVKEDTAVTEEAQKVFDSAMPDHDRVKYDAVALLGTQVVAGTNYCFLIRTVMDEPDAQPSYQIVYIYQDLDGNVQVLEVKDIALGLDGDGTDGGNEILEEGEHHITLAGDEYVFVDCPEKAKAGETVTVHTVDVCDGEVKLTVNGSDIGTWQEWGTYTFTMPDEDVEINGWISTEGYPGA